MNGNFQVFAGFLKGTAANQVVAAHAYELLQPLIGAITKRYPDMAREPEVRERAPSLAARLHEFFGTGAKSITPLIELPQKNDKCIPCNRVGFAGAVRLKYARLLSHHNEQDCRQAVERLFAGDWSVPSGTGIGTTPVHDWNRYALTSRLHGRFPARAYNVLCENVAVIPYLAAVAAVAGQPKVLYEIESVARLLIRCIPFDRSDDPAAPWSVACLP